MRGRGITYDTGFIHAGASTHESFDPGTVEREMRIIRDDLHCTAVRVTGGDPGRLETAARYAADAGLEVWFSPFTCDLTQDELLGVLGDCAHRAERLRRGGAEIVLVTGAELTLFTKGFLPGDTLEDRLAVLAAGRLLDAARDATAKLNAFLAQAVRTVRDRFGGQVAYAALPSEQVDWAPFDFVGADLYRSAEIADRYTDAVRGLVALGKPVAITEFGCTTHHGAADQGAHGMSMVEWDRTTPLRLVGEPVRDESEQATYARELLEIFTAEGVDTAFWCTFASYNLPHHDDAEKDFDRASYGLVKVLPGRTGQAYPGMPWEPKEGFHALADHYAHLADETRR